MKKNMGPLLLRYGCAVVSIALATRIRLLLDPVLGIQFPFATIFFAVLLTAWYGGFRPALAAVFLGAVSTAYFIMPPRGSFTLTGADQEVGMLLYCSTSLGIALLGGLMHDASRRAGASNQAERRQAALIDQTYDAVLVWEWDGPITFWNSGAERIYGFSREEARGRVSHDLLQTSCSIGVSAFVDFLERNGLWEGELEHTTRDGRRIAVETRMVLVREAGHSYVLEANRDITRRRQMEAELREANEHLESRVRERTAELAKMNESLQTSEERFRLIIESVQEYAIFMLDTAGRVVTWNIGAQRTKGYREAEILGSHFSQFYPEEDIKRGKPEAELRTALLTGHCEDEGWRIRHDGSRFWAKVVITALKDQDGHPRGFAKVTRDITEKMRADKLLLDSETKFRSYIENAPVAILAANSEGKFAECNPAAVALLGYEADALMGMPITAIHLEVEAAEVRRTIDALIREGNVEGEFRMRRGDGRLIWVSLRAVMLSDGHSLGFCNDITERKQIQAALQAERDRFAKIVSTVPVVICSFRRRPDGTFCFPFSTAAIEQIYGVRPEQLVEDASPAFTRMHPDDVVHVHALIEESARTMTAWRSEFRIRDPQRGEIWVEGHSVPTIEADGGILWQGYIADVTERKKAQTALLSAHNRLQTVLGSITDGMLVLDKNWCYTYFNEQGARAVFMRPEQLIGRCIWEVFPHAKDAKFHECFHRAVETGQFVQFEEYYPDPINKWFECHCYPSIEGLSVYFHDVTLRKSAEETLRRANTELERGMQQLAAANRELNSKTQENETFVYSVSHDLRSPLVNLLGFSKELDRSAQDLRMLFKDNDLSQPVRDSGLELLDGPIAKSIRFIQSAVARLSGIIDALLRLSRAGRVVYQRQPVELQSIVARVVESVKLTMEERNATITFNELPPAFGDPAALEQIFANLIGNALNYLDSNRPGRIEIGCVESAQKNTIANMMTYFVRDNGLGISEAGRGKVFQPLQRLHPQAAPGEGMGLAIIQRVVERLGGRIWFESVVGQGTSFFVALPACPHGEPPPASPLSGQRSQPV